MTQGPNIHDLTLVMVSLTLGLNLFTFLLDGAEINLLVVGLLLKSPLFLLKLNLLYYLLVKHRFQKLLFFQICHQHLIVIGLGKRWIAMRGLKVRGLSLLPILLGLFL